MRINPYYYPVAGREPFSTTKRKNKIYWPKLTGVHTSNPADDMITNCRVFHQKHHGNPDRDVRYFADNCGLVAFLAELSGYSDRGLPPIAIDINKPLQTETDHINVARLYYRVALTSALHVDMVELWKIHGFLQGMLHYYKQLPFLNKLCWQNMEGIGNKIYQICQQQTRLQEAQKIQDEKVSIGVGPPIQ